ncbi:hypothetical protein, partial [Pantoea sp. R102]|uniref:hypothetical protein n=1 Tax=Pantoea sp. R102 TaxID=2507583 RepID=UPI001B3C9FDC
KPWRFSMNNKKPTSILTVHFPPEVMNWIDSVRGKKSRQAWLSRLMKDMRIDNELEIIISQSEHAGN